MLIDWFTVIAQIVNFLLLIWLLNRFLYRPILRAMAAREQKIAESVAGAEQARQQAEQERAALERERRELSLRREELLAAAATQATTEKERLLREARLLVEQQQAAWEQTLESDRTAFFAELQRQLRFEAFQLTRQLLHDLSSVTLEQLIAGSFLAQYQSLPANEKQRFLAPLNHDNAAPVFLYSAFPLPAAQRLQLEQELRHEIAIQHPLQFEVDPDLICGIELVIGGETLAWNLQNHLALLQQRMEELLEGAKHHASDA